MNKQLWYANSTGGVPYTYGEVFARADCELCDGVGRGCHEYIDTFEGIKMYHFSSNKNGKDLCPGCEGKKVVKRLI